MSISLTKQTVVIPAGGQIPRSHLGNYFLCVTADNPFKVQFEGGERVDMAPGFAVNFRTVGVFNQIWFYNAQSVAVTVTYYVTNGSVEYFSAIQTVIFNKAAGSYTKGGGATVLANGGSLTFNGLDGTNLRKQIVVTNMSATATLDLQDGSGLVFGAVFPQQAWTLETNGVVKVVNNSGANATVRVGEAFYS